MMETPVDFRLLARRYLDLWQEQVAAMVSDPALAESVARGISGMAQTVWANDKGKAGDDTTPAEDPVAAARAAAAAVASDRPRFDSDELARRFAALEERVAALGAWTGGQGAGAEGKHRRRRD